MKRKLAGFLIFFIVINCFSVLSLAQDNDICVTIDGKIVRFDVEPQMVNDRVMVPMRKIFEDLGCEVDWNDETSTAAAKSGKTTVKATVGSKIMYVNGQARNIDVSPIMINDRVLVPVRFIAEGFDCFVTWDENSQTVIIQTNNNEKSESKFEYPKEMSAEDIYKKCSPAVFYIEIYNQNNNLMASGSGFVIDEKGIAVTNYHVIENAYYAHAKFTDSDKAYNIEGVYDFNKDEDWAVIKLEGENFNFLNPGDEQTVVNGAEVYAIGSPLGLENTISQGLISTAKRDLNGKNYIQISAPISPGSSGGALLNKFGDVIGITSAKMEEGENLGFAIPISIINGYNSSDLKALEQCFYRKSENSLNSDNNQAFNILYAFSKVYANSFFGRNFAYKETEYTNTGYKSCYLLSDDEKGVIDAVITEKYKNDSYYLILSVSNLCDVCSVYYSYESGYKTGYYESEGEFDPKNYKRGDLISFSTVNSKSDDEMHLKLSSAYVSDCLDFLNHIYSDYLGVYAKFSVGDIGFVNFK